MNNRICKNCKRKYHLDRKGCRYKHLCSDCLDELLEEKLEYFEELEFPKEIKTHLQKGVVMENNELIKILEAEIKKLKHTPVPMDEIIEIEERIRSLQWRIAKLKAQLE